MVLLDDLVEDILQRLGVEDLLRYKIVCKSWCSLISTHRFAKAHLKKSIVTCNNNDNKELGHVRIAMPTYWKVPNEKLYKFNSWKVIGSSNGLVCFIVPYTQAPILVNNPRTREVRTLPKPPLLTERILPMSFSFGYDSSTDDYKLVMGVWIDTTNETLFQVLSLKSNTWKLLGVFNYRVFNDRPGIQFDGALHWLAFDYCSGEKKRVMLSFDLSREEFTSIIPGPGRDDLVEYGPPGSYVGIVEDQLCIFLHRIKDKDLPCNNIWVMKSCKGEGYWEKLPDNYETKYQVVHYMKLFEFTSSMKKKYRMSFFCDDNKCLSRDGFHIKSPLFVPSLVSPYAGRPSHAKKNKTSVKSWRRKYVGEGQQQLQCSVRSGFCKVSEQRIGEIEAVYRREVGETQNFYFHEEGNREIKEIVTKIEGDTLCAEGVKNYINENEKQEEHVT